MTKIAACASALLVVAASMAGAPASARQRDPRVVPGRGTDSPRFVTRIDDGVRSGAPARVARAHLRDEQDLYRIPSPGRNLRVLDVARRGRSETVRFGQLHRGVPVFGAQYLVHTRRDGSGRSVTYANGHYFTDLTVSTAPRVSEDGARTIATRRGRLARVDEIVSHGATVLPGGSGVLAYHFTVTGSRFGRPVRDEVFVNAHTGGVALAYNNLQHSHGPVPGTGTPAHGGSVPLQVFHNGAGTFEMRDRSRAMFGTFGGEITTHDVSGAASYEATPSNIETSATSSFTDGAAVDAHYNAGLTYEYFQALGRDSIDDAGMPIVSSVHFQEVPGEPYYNAFWDGTQMIYGDGDPAQTYPFSSDLDVVAHELTHGVTEFTANLVYLNQSGAMNEAYSDYFGQALDADASGIGMSDPTSGYIGEDLCKPGATAFPCPLRDLNDGATASDYVFYMFDFDNGGVHLNSTIYGGALWDIRQSIDKDNADVYVLRSLENCLTPLSDYFDGRNCTVAEAQAAGASPAQITAINAAFDGKGIVAGWDLPAGGTDSKTLRTDVFPVGFFSSGPQASGSRYVVADYNRLTDSCCKPLRIWVGKADGSGKPKAVGEHNKASTLNDEMPDISGKRVVWGHGRVTSGGGVDFDVHTRVLGGKVTNVQGGSGFQWFPSVGGRLVAWEDTRSGDTNVWARKVGRGKSRKMTGAAGEQWLPQVSGDWIAWWDVGDFSSQPVIRLRNFATGKRVTITGSNPDAFVGPPGVGPDHVYWFEDTNLDGDGRIRRAKLNGKRKKTVVAEGQGYSPVWIGDTNLLIPSANSKWVTYNDELFYLVDPSLADPEQIGRDVWIARASGGPAKLVTANRGDQAYPAMAGGRRVVWFDTAKAQTDLVTQKSP